MSFSYDPELDNDLDLVRFNLNDTIKDDGPRPNKANFQNEELRQLITNNVNWQLAVADGFDILASAWAKETTFSVHNGSFSRSDAASRFADLANGWRKRFGESPSAPKRPGSVPTTKVDYGFEV